jgi:hypothetical protein
MTPLKVPYLGAVGILRLKELLCNAEHPPAQGLSLKEENDTIILAGIFHVDVAQIGCHADVIPESACWCNMESHVPARHARAPTIPLHYVFLSFSQPEEAAVSAQASSGSRCCKKEQKVNNAHHSFQVA